jgi:hypothetical protein
MEQRRQRRSDFEAVRRALLNRAARGDLEVDARDIAVELEIPIWIVSRILRRILRGGGLTEAREGTQR